MLESTNRYYCYTHALSSGTYAGQWTGMVAARFCYLKISGSYWE